MITGPSRSADIEQTLDPRRAWSGAAAHHRRRGLICRCRTAWRRMDRSTRPARAACSPEIAASSTSPTRRPPFRHGAGRRSLDRLRIALEGRAPRRLGPQPQGGTKPGWSELFFLDEVTALAAGHRPCFACRRADARALRRRRSPSATGSRRRTRPAWTRSCTGNAGNPPGDSPPCALTARRNARTAGRRDDRVARTGTSRYTMGGRLPWSFDGYGAPVAFADLPGEAPLLVTSAMRGRRLAGRLPPALACERIAA